MISHQKLAKKIKKTREELGISQQDFAQKINLSRTAVSQLELGKRGLDALELAKIAEILGVSVDFLFHEDKEKGNKLKKPAAAEFLFEEDKLRNLILYILNKCGGKPNVGETVLYKLLYFVDFDCFEAIGRPLTGMTYVKMQFGPVPKTNQFNKAISKMINDKELEIVSNNYYGMTQKRYISWKEYDIKAFMPEELEIINSVISRLSDMTAKQIEDYVHNDAPWKIAVDREAIDYNLVFERTTPYTRRNYEGLWQEAAAADTLNALGPMSDKEYEYYQNF